MEMIKLIGPFRQLLTMAHLPLKGALSDDQLEVIEEGAVVVFGGKIVAIGKYDHLAGEWEGRAEPDYPEGDTVGIPGLIDAHTHICFAGSRAMDYSMRVGGKSYLEIAHSGGGIWTSVTHTRNASVDELVALTRPRMERLLNEGVTTAEVKSGYGLNPESELNMLRAIKKAGHKAGIDTIGTCLAAHIKPKDFDGMDRQYLDLILNEILPQVKAENLAGRVDIFIEESAFSVEDGEYFLQKAIEQGFEITVHGDQFTPGGSEVAVNVGAKSVDHLEASGEKEIALIAQSDTVAVALPGASMGLGVGFTPARKLLDAGACLAIASDWNPGSAPMGDLLIQASVLGAYEKLSVAETLAGVTVRAAKALNLSDRGELVKGKLADIAAFPTSDYRDILYHQGKLKPSEVWKRGKQV